jgi:hypothetical protein
MISVCLVSVEAAGDALQMSMYLEVTVLDILFRGSKCRFRNNIPKAKVKDTPG